MEIESLRTATMNVLHLELHEQSKNKTNQPREEQNWQIKQIHPWKNKQLKKQA